MTSTPFERNVFINCPFDPQYLPLLRALLFTIIFCGLNPRIASERSNSGEMRLSKIIELIELSKYSIHDLSRVKATKVGQHFRLNMPFEMGIDWGFKHYKKVRKLFLILESERDGSRQAISDLAGCDFEFHNNEPEELVVVVRNWFANNLPNLVKGGSVIWNNYNEFYAKLYETKDFSKRDVDRLPISELIRYMKDWCKNKTN